MKNTISWIVLVVVLLICFAVPLAGCSENAGRNSVSGSVTFDGQALKKGSISFQPLPGTKATSAGGHIIGGSLKSRPTRD